jgi:hypothetical protein
VSFLERNLEDPVRFARMKRWFYAGLAVIAVTEVVALYLFRVEPAHFWFEDIPAFGSIYGVISCIVIIVVSKLLGKLWLMRPENHYDR